MYFGHGAALNICCRESRPRHKSDSPHGLDAAPNLDGQDTELRVGCGHHAQQLGHGGPGELHVLHFDVHALQALVGLGEHVQEACCRGASKKDRDGLGSSRILYAEGAPALADNRNREPAQVKQVLESDQRLSA